jgi:hypothetical protein
MNKIILFLCFLGTISTASAAIGDSIPEPILRSKHQLGFNAGAVSGLGLSYRYVPQGKMMHQFTFLPILTSDFYFVDVAYTMFYRIREKQYTDFNTYAGTHFMFTEEGVVNVTGGGLGFDFQLSDFCVNINGGFGLYSNVDGGVGLFPTGELGLFYKL